jgi:hypothetical protein
MKKIFWGLIFLSGFLTLTSCASPELKARFNSECNETIYPSAFDRAACRVRIGNEEREQRLALEQEARQKAQQEQQQRKVQAYLSELRNACRAFGFNENTDSFRNCLMSQHQANVAALQRQQQIDAANSAANSSAYLANQEYMRQMNEAFNRLNPNHPSYYLR